MIWGHTYVGNWIHGQLLWDDAPTGKGRHPNPLLLIHVRTHLMRTFWKKGFSDWSWFRPLFDWVRTDLSVPWRDGTRALALDMATQWITLFGLKKLWRQKSNSKSPIPFHTSLLFLLNRHKWEVFEETLLILNNTVCKKITFLFTKNPLSLLAVQCAGPSE